MWKEKEVWLRELGKTASSFGASVSSSLARVVKIGNRDQIASPQSLVLPPLSPPSPPLGTKGVSSLLQLTFLRGVVFHTVIQNNNAKPNGPSSVPTPSLSGLTLGECLYLFLHASASLSI